MGLGVLVFNPPCPPLPVRSPAERRNRASPPQWHCSALAAPASPPWWCQGCPAPEGGTTVPCSKAEGQGKNQELATAIYHRPPTPPHPLAANIGRVLKFLPLTCSWRERRDESPGTVSGDLTALCKLFSYKLLAFLVRNPQGSGRGFHKRGWIIEASLNNSERDGVGRGETSGGFV